MQLRKQFYVKLMTIAKVLTTISFVKISNRKKLNIETFQRELKQKNASTNHYGLFNLKNGLELSYFH
jgi:hypothetical protein